MTNFCWLAVTLEGTVIHKSGLITGGRSSHGNNKKWDEKDVQGTEQRELNQQRARAKSDESLISEISRLESLITVAKDDLVCFLNFN